MPAKTCIFSTTKEATTAQNIVTTTKIKVCNMPMITRPREDPGVRNTSLIPIWLQRSCKSVCCPFLTSPDSFFRGWLNNNKLWMINTRKLKCSFHKNYHNTKETNTSECPGPLPHLHASCLI